MAAAATDLLQEVSIASATTLDSPGYTIGDTSITVVSVSTWPTATGITFAMDEVDAAGVQVAGTYNEYVGVKASATSITNVSHQNGTNQNYTAGATTRVYIPVSAERENRIVEWGLTEHEQNGTHAVELITSRTEDTDPDPDADFLLSYDTSAAALKKVKPSNLSGGLTGWTSNVLPSVSSVTNNGNRSYTMSFGSSIASYLSPGMRIRATRTVTAPTQCADLEASSSQYFNDTSVSGMTFTDDFVVSAWVKLESYTVCVIASRYNGTSGWDLIVGGGGIVEMRGMNAGAGNYSKVSSYQSLPLGRWVHVTAQLDMSSFTATSTTSYIMFDGVDVPAVVARAGTNPTALVQAGNLEIGAENGGTAPFDGKIAQVAIYSAKVTQANVRATISQGLTGSETSLVSAYSFNNSINDLNANANNLTAQGGAAATNADSPFGVNSFGTAVGTYEYGIVTGLASSTDVYVQFPEGSCPPTSGGVSAVDLSSVKVPYGFPADEGRWRVNYIWGSQTNSVSNATFAAYAGMSFVVPVGAWHVGFQMGLFNTTTTTVNWCLSATSQTGLAATASDKTLQVGVTSTGSTMANTAHVRTSVNLPSASTYVMYQIGSTTGAGILGSQATSELFAEFALL